MYKYQRSDLKSEVEYFMVPSLRQKNPKIVSLELMALQNIIETQTDIGVLAVLHRETQKGIRDLSTALLEIQQDIRKLPGMYDEPQLNIITFDQHLSDSFIGTQEEDAQHHKELELFKTPSLEMRKSTKDRGQPEVSKASPTVRATSFNLESSRRVDASWEDVMDWIYPNDFEITQRSLREKRVSGSGRWFLDHPSFECWLSPETPNLLWCPGPGVPSEP